MTKKIYITRKIPEVGIKMLKDKGYEVDVNPKDRVISKKEFIKILKKKSYDAVLCLLTDKIDGEVMDAAPSVKIFANYAVGFDNIDLSAAKIKGITITNTPGVLTEAVAEHAIALALAISRRIPEADNFTKKGKYKGWAPMLLLGDSILNKKLGILGLGRIGSKLAHIAVSGFGAKIIYYDIKRNESFEKEFPMGAVEYRNSIEEVLKEGDIVSIHLPLMPETRHIINKGRLAMMKRSSYLINTSRGAIIDEEALVEALKNKIIKGAALDVFENEPKLAKGLVKLENVVITPHIASATEKARDEMAVLAATNIIVFFEGNAPPNVVK